LVIHGRELEVLPEVLYLRLPSMRDALDLRRPESLAELALPVDAVLLNRWRAALRTRSVCCFAPSVAGPGLGTFPALVYEFWFGMGLGLGLGISPAFMYDDWSGLGAP